MRTRESIDLEIRRLKQQLAHLEAELELVSTHPRLNPHRIGEEAPSAARRLRRAIAATRTGIARLRSRMPASDEI